MTIKSVDLRGAYEQTYNQGTDNACGAYALCNALDCLFERATVKPHRFDPNFVWSWARWFTGVSGNSGVLFPGLIDALNLKGAKLVDAESPVTGFRMVTTHPSLERIKHLLCMGVPVLWMMKITPAIGSQNNRAPWQTHHWGDLRLSEQTGMHFVCVMGFDDDAGRWLIENSWGSDGWGDGGFFGIRYDDFLTLSEGFSHIDIAPVLPKPFQGNSVLVTTMTFSEAGDFVDRSKSGLKTLFAEKMSVGGATEVVKLAVSLGVSDKHLEYIFGWPRGAVREFARANPNINFDGFVWDQL